METGAFGNEAYILTGYFNIPKILELALFNGYDNMSGASWGLRPDTAMSSQAMRNCGRPSAPRCVISWI